MGTEPVDYCREIEAYLCRKNEGHLIRVVGPSFDLVSRWEADGIPLKVAFRGIDRTIERQMRKAGRHRPVKIDFCESDVLDAFDEWRRAVGVPAAAGRGASDVEAAAPSPARSLPKHLERAVLRLTNARATGAAGDAFDETIDRVARELDGARAAARGIRGEARAALLARLKAIDRDLLDAARASLDDPARAALVRQAGEELAPYRSRMAPDAFARACDAAVDRLVRERLGLPTIAMT
ncbi:MAG: hypothetical protein ACM3SQ_10460 [Betaproteobacteria bacterium]